MIKRSGKNQLKLSAAILASVLCILIFQASSFGAPFHQSVIDGLKEIDPGRVTIVESTPPELNSPAEVNSEEAFTSLMDGAKEEIIFETYYIQKSVSSKFLDSIKNAAGRGVKIKLLLADILHADKTLAVELSSKYSNIDVRFLDLKKFSYLYGSIHCKTILVDNRYTVVGGTNYSFMGFFENRETAVIIDDRDFAFNMRKVFELDWDVAGVLDSNGKPAPDYKNYMPRASEFLLVEAAPNVLNNPYIANYQPTLSNLFDSAKKSIFFEIDYYSDFGGIYESLKNARARGVEVKIIIEERSYFDENPLYQSARNGIDRLIADGFDVYLFNLAPMGVVENRGMMHSKAAVVDSELVYVGSANISKSGFLYSREAGVIFKSKNVAARLLDIFNSDLKNPFCVPGADAVKNRYSYSRYKENQNKDNTIYLRRNETLKKVDSMIIYNSKSKSFKTYDYTSAR
ncbi:MAG TPA: phosphatidylserine/phosphatidylglycerophosphate/cardiolipin synthase family protein [Candidatus Wallbacteria bacterium]|nr:phosphatidylserine/phosphatidylglycerophosphate/cardiolipin synthase family protein [Candidatus Wallbacteria bacterium]